MEDFFLLFCPFFFFFLVGARATERADVGRRGRHGRGETAAIAESTARTHLESWRSIVVGSYVTLVPELELEGVRLTPHAKETRHGTSLPCLLAFQEGKKKKKKQNKTKWVLSPNDSDGRKRRSLPFAVGSVDDTAAFACLSFGVEAPQDSPDTLLLPSTTPTSRGATFVPLL